MAKPKHQNGSFSASSEGVGKEIIIDDSVQPNELNFSNLSANIRAKFQSFEKGRKKDSQKPYKQKKAQKFQVVNAEPDKVAQSTQSSSVSASRGKKRGHNGEVLPKLSSINAKPTEVEPVADGRTLQEEVFALGGTAEDISLINGIQSESDLEDEQGTDGEDEDSAQRKHGLQKGMKNILKEIALAQRAADTDGDSGGASEEGSSQENVTSENELSRPPVAASPSPGHAGKPSTSRQGQSRLSFEQRPDWFNSQGPDIERTNALTFTLPRNSLDQLHDYAKSLLDAENELYKKNQQSKSSQNFYSTVIASGTLSDKVSALTLAVQESPVHNVKALETLISLAKKRSRAQAVDVLRALKDLFAQGSLLPHDRKLYTFNANPEVLASFNKTKSWKTGDVLPGTVKPQHLIYWAYESWLKEVYFDVLKILEVWCNDEIEFSKSRAVSYVFELLKEKPEQEANLLRMLVNKLGDPVKKIASQASYLIMQLMVAHPAMKETIVSAVEAELLFRPGQGLHAKYYAIVTLNQTALSNNEESLASKLLDIYFGLFVGLLKPAEEEKLVNVVLSGTNTQELNGKHRKRKNTTRSVDSGRVKEDELRDKFTSAILTGINRAYPYTSANQETLSKHLDALFKITHSANFNTSIQAMLLIQQLSALHQASHDRFYRTLYESLLDARLIESSKQSLYLNLLFRSLKADVNHKRVKAFAKRITQILTLHQPSFVCGAFFLLQELEATFPSLSGLIDQPEEHDVDEETLNAAVEGDTLVTNPVPPASGPSQGDKANSYDGRKRDPEHSHAESSCLWELLPFLAHYHPSVSVSADHFLRRTKLPGTPDLNLHTLIHFLDRFVYRNPKASSSKLRGSSIMQPLAASESSGLLLNGAPAIQQGVPVNTQIFKAQEEGNVAADDVFFHRYFNSLGKETPKSKARAHQEAVEGISVADGEESEIWKAMMEPAPNLECVDDSDDDIEMEDLESDFEESVDEMSADLEKVDDDEDDEDDEGDEDEEHWERASSDGLEGELMVLDDDASDDGGPLLASKTPSESTKYKNPNKERRKKIKGLPTFASASDYAKMLEDEEGEDLG
jgi:ribosome biogenesis protein MAK21